MSAVLVPAASEAEWLAERRRGVTASEIAVLMGLSPFSSPYKLYHQKLGVLPPDDDSAVMERGRVLEPYIAGRFAAAHPELLIAGNGRELFAHPGRRWQLATPDRVAAYTEDVLDYRGEDLLAQFVVECKVDGGDGSGWGEEGTADIPVHYRAQVLWQMDVMGTAAGYVACLRVRDWRIREYALRMDGDARQDLALMLTEAKEFLSRLERRDPPDVDWHPATLSALKTLHPAVTGADVPVRRSLAIQYRAAVRRHAAAGRRKDEMTARMLAAIGDGRRAVDARTGEPVATRSVSHPRTVSTTLLRAKYPAIAAECTPASPPPVIRLTPAPDPRKDRHAR